MVYQDGNRQNLTAPQWPSSKWKENILHGQVTNISMECLFIVSHVLILDLKLFRNFCLLATFHIFVNCV